MLLDDGNFVITRESNSYPTDTWLPRGGKIGYNKIRNEKMSLTSWRNSENPAPSLFSVEVEQNGPSIKLVYYGTNLYWSSGKWTGTTFLGVPEIDRSYYITNYKYVSNENESKFTYITYVPNSLTRFMVDVTGQFRQLVWQQNIEWIQFWAKLEKLAKSAEEKKTDWNIWIPVGAFGGLFIFIVVVVLVIIRRRKQKVRTSSGTVEDALMVFKYKEIRNATRDFSQKLGEGSFGYVFKGTLPNSRVIAVKSLNNLTQGEKQFCTEVNTIGLIQQINLVCLQGFCIKGTKRFLVYDYMKNGSLGSYLFQKDSNVFLDWKARYNIMIGIARGLVYLHEECRNCIIHCDIKPDNILLDDEFSPKVADFGLAKLLGRDFSRVLTTLRGTIGYLAPEWISGEPLTVKTDAFSYGMLLFEIISGKRNRDGIEDYIPAKVAQTINEGGKELMLLLDQRLQGNSDLVEVARACKVACWCIQDDEKDRPSMGLVVKILEGISEVGNPPIPRFLSLEGFGKYKSQTFNSQIYTSDTTLTSISLE